jgi:peptide/nickel transport system permease protein
MIEGVVTPTTASASWRHTTLSWRQVPLSMIAGGMIVLVAVLVAVLADRLAPYPFDQFQNSAQFRPPGLPYLFGTDEYGRDVFSRVLVGSRISLSYGIGCAVVSLLLGVPIGLCAGYFGGRTDEIIMRTIDIVLSIPPLMLGLLILAVTPPNLAKTIVAIGIINTPSAARIVRSAALGLRREDFVDAARAAGESHWYIIRAELLPNIWPVIIVEGTLRVAFGILIGAALSYLGLGAQPPSSDWGLMLNQARDFVGRAPWISIYPGVAMSLVVIGFSLFGTGLRDLLDPRLD